MEKTMERKKHQEALTVKEQIENLKSLNLIIKDEYLATQFLNDVSYFRFIKAYSLSLKPKNGNYYDGVTFEQLVELYLFNANFRQLLFAQIEKVEINLRCRISNYFSSTYGVLGYKNVSNFANANYHTAFLIDIQSEINRNKRAPFIKNFQNNYENSDIPFYALVEIFSFGTLSKFFKNMKNADKKFIAGTTEPVIHILRAGLRALPTFVIFAPTMDAYIMPNSQKRQNCTNKTVILALRISVCLAY